MKADVIHLVETSLNENETAEFSIPGYSSHAINVGNGKGILTFYRTAVVEHQRDLKETNLQITKFSSSTFDVVNTYRSANGNSVELLSNLINMTSKEKAILITGDFNICYQENKTNRLIQGLENHGFRQLVQEATHIRGRHIDQAYWKDPTNTWSEPDVDRYSPYYSDHDAIGLTFTKKCKY